MARRNETDTNVSPARGSAAALPEGRPAEAGGAARSRHSVHDLDLLWVQLRGSWGWLAVISAEPGFSTQPLAERLCEVGSRLSLHRMELMLAANLDLDTSSRLIAHLQASAKAGDLRGSTGQHAPGATRSAPPHRTLVALESPLVNPLALPVALAADGVILCAVRGRTRLDSIRKTVEMVGADRILCSFLLDESRGNRAPSRSVPSLTGRNARI